MRPRYVVTGLGALLIVLVTVGLWPVDVLTMRFPRDDTPPLILARVPPDRQLILAYLHSVEKTPVEGVFRITTDNQFEIQQTRYTSVGTGLPTDAAQNPTREGDWFVVQEGKRKLNSIRFFSIPENRVQLRLGDVVHDISVSAMQGRSLIELEVKKAGFLRVIFLLCDPIFKF